MVKTIRTYQFKFDYNMFQNDVRSFIEAHELKHTDLDVLAGCKGGITSAVLKGTKRNHKLDTWMKIANAMDMDVRTYFVLDI